MSVGAARPTRPRRPRRRGLALDPVKQARLDGYTRAAYTILGAVVVLAVLGAVVVLSAVVYGLAALVAWLS